MKNDILGFDCEEVIVINITGPFELNDTGHSDR